MCGIVGYLGEKDAKKHVMEGLRRLEYRGYDSAGIAYYDEAKADHLVFKEKGRLENLAGLLPEGGSQAAIGHTRWATHGRVTKENAHPHESHDGRFIVVHNGIIENHKALAEEYLAGIPRKSATDTEIIASLLGHFAKGKDVAGAFRQVLDLLEGSYALLLMDREHPDILYAAKKKSPLLIGQNGRDTIIASDLTALCAAATDYLALEDGSIVTIDERGFSVRDGQGKAVRPVLSPVDKAYAETDKGVFDHYMLKEIHEQPAVLRRITAEYFDQETPRIRKDISAMLQKAKRLHILAAGTSMHAGIVGKALFENLARLPTEVHIASEFAHHPPLLEAGSVFLLISQSGETADLRASLEIVKEKGFPSLTLTNVKTSTLAREADKYLEIFAGPEIAVASTKAYTAQIAVLAILAFALGDGGFSLRKELALAAQGIENHLQDHKMYSGIVAGHLKKPHAFYIGRGLDYAVALEAALKLKEISYIHTEGFAAGELKHGTIALIEEGIPVIALVTEKRTAAHTRSAIAEVESRGADVLVIATENVAEKEDGIRLDTVHPLLTPLVCVVPTQLIAYYAALQRGTDIDKPRNLAKSVTVE